MKKATLTMLFAVLLVSFAFGQVINNFDAEPDSGYWAHETSDNADSTLGWINISYITDPVLEGTGAMQLDYSVHNIEGWGGYSKIYHLHPDIETGGTWDWSAYDSISISYYNSVAQSAAGSVHLRINISDYAGITDSSYTGLGEYYYSFHYILDNEAGWNTITMPLVRNDSWDGQGFNLTGWAGDADNGELETHAIGGFHFEFSIGGSGEGNHTTGTIVLDNLTLTGYQGAELVLFNGMNYPGACSPFTWGGSQLSVTEGGGFDDGTNALTWIQGDEWSNGWTGAGFNINPPVDLATGNEWNNDKLQFHLKADADCPAIRIQLESGEDGKIGHTFTPEADGVWHFYEVELASFVNQDGTENFNPGAISVLNLVAEANGAWGRTLHFDNFWTGNPDFDVIAPEAPTGLGALANEFYNLVYWQDVPGESGESYSVYASPEPITDLNDPLVDIVATGVLEDVQSVAHWLMYPLDYADVSYYYAVTCTDAARNVSATFAVTADAVSNTAKGTPTISLNPPATFVADGDLSEWEASGITPYIMTPETYFISAGTVADGNDLTGTVYLAVDNDFLYIAIDAIDDVYTWGEGDWWNQDAFEMFIGLYDQRGAKHVGMQRGEEPDYKIVMDGTSCREEFGGATFYQAGDEGYYLENFGGQDYVIETKVSLDSIVAGEDARFYPVRGMRIPIEITFHDNDGAGWEGNLTTSSINTDNAWQTPQVWSQTWIGDTTHVATGVEGGLEKSAVSSYTLSQNYPNPFNPTTTIDYSISAPVQVKIEVYNMVGQKVKTLVNERKESGVYSVQFDATDMTSGIYFYQIEAGDFKQTNKMILMK